MESGTTSTRISVDLKERLQEYCGEQGKIQYRVVDEAVRRYLDEARGRERGKNRREDRREEMVEKLERIKRAVEDKS